MNRELAIVVIALLLGLGCATQQADVDQPESTVRVLRAEQIGSRPYDVVTVLEDQDMLGVGAGSSARASSEASLTSRMARKAAGLDADGVIVKCTGTRQSVSCKGIVIRWTDEAEAED